MRKLEALSLGYMICTAVIIKINVISLLAQNWAQWTGHHKSRDDRRWEQVHFYWIKIWRVFNNGMPKTISETLKVVDILSGS